MLGDRVRLSKSDELRESGSCQIRRSSVDEDDRNQAVEKSRIRATGVALLKAFDHGDMSGFLSAWSVRELALRDLSLFLWILLCR